MDEWWIEPMRRVFAGRAVVLAGAMASSWTEHIELLHSVGVSKVLVVATEGRGAGPLPDVPTVIVEPRPGLSQMERIHVADRILHEPTSEMVTAIETFDPTGEALVVATFLSTATHLLGRPVVSSRRPEWLALEDKVVVDAFWDRAGIDRQPSRVVALDEAEGAASEIDRGDGTVWAADAREGFHGGAARTYWVSDDASRNRAVAGLASVCDSVRVMPFLEGVPCSIHGIVLPDSVAVLRPVEMVTLRRGHELAYAGCATYWDPDPIAHEQMRTVARRAGDRLREEVDYRGTFTVDGVVTSDGFWPTELNPRFGAGVMTIARGVGIPLVLVNDLVVGGHDVGRTAAELEDDIVEQGDARRGGGTWQSGLDVATHLESEPVQYREGTWAWSRSGGPVDAHVTAGAGFVRCLYEQASTPIGPSTAPRAAAFWQFVAAEFGVDTAGLTAARA